MSEEQLKAFLEKVKGDTSLQEKLKAAKSPEDVVGIAKDCGHKFNSDVINQLGKEKDARPSISEEELELLSGGYIVLHKHLERECMNNSQISKPTP